MIRFYTYILCIYIKLNCLQNYSNVIFYIYSDIYFFQSYIAVTWYIVRCMQVGNIVLLHSYISYYLKLFLSYFFRLIFLKLKFIGKGYKLLIRKTKWHHVILFNFGYSHRYYIYLYNFYYTQLAKTKFIFIGLNFFLLKLVLTSLYWIKPINIFTLRGLRFFQQCIFKKTGKVSAYM